MPAFACSRPITLKPGDKCWIDGLHCQQWVPEWLPRFAEVTYLGVDPENNAKAILRDVGGCEFRVAHNVYYGPHEWLLDGRWLPEADPRVYAHLRLLLEEPTPYWDSAPWKREEYHAKLIHILTRNGIS